MYKKGVKRKRQAERTKSILYNTAATLFAERGFDAVTIEDIATGAGVSVGAFYHHFKNKQEILAVTYQSLDEKYKNYYEKVAEAPGFVKRTSIERLEFFMLHTIGVIARLGPEFLSVFYQYLLKDATFIDSMLDKDRAFFVVLQKLVEEGKAHGEITASMSVEQVMLDLTAIVRGCAVEWCLCKGNRGIYLLSATVIKNYLLGISAGTECGR